MFGVGRPRSRWGCVGVGLVWGSVSVVRGCGVDQVEPQQGCVHVN